MVLPDPVSIPSRPRIAGSLRTVLSLAVLAPLLLASRLDQMLAGRTVSAPLPALLAAFLLALLPLLLTFLLALLPLLLAFLLALLPTLLAAFLPALLAAFPAPVPGTVAPTFSPAAPSPTAFTGLVEAASVSSSAHAFLLFF
jgi:hypothetical protein